MNEKDTMQLEVELAETRRALVATALTLKDYQSTTAAQRAQIESLAAQVEKEKERGDMWYSSYERLNDKFKELTDDNA